jgi:hypothetical protein
MGLLLQAYRLVKPAAACVGAKLLLGTGNILNLLAAVPATQLRRKDGFGGFHGNLHCLVLQITALFA